MENNNENLTNYDKIDDIIHEYWTRIDALRIEKGISVKNLCDKLGITISYFHSSRSRGSILSVEKTVRIAEIFGTSLDYLYLGKSLASGDVTINENFVIGRMRDFGSFKKLILLLLDKDNNYIEYLLEDLSK